MPKVIPIISMLLLLIAPLVASSDPLPALHETDLYQKTARNCESVDLLRWPHPTLGVISESGVDLKKAERCNSGSYLIFYVNFKYDPQGSQTKDFFVPFYEKLRVANGGKPLAFVAISDSMVVYVGFLGPHQLNVEFEPYLSGTE